MGDPTPIQYAAVGETTSNWEYDDFKALYVAVFQYYKQWYAKQQEYVTQINACETVKAVRDIEITYKTDAEIEQENAESESPEE